MTTIQVCTLPTKKRKTKKRKNNHTEIEKKEPRDEMTTIQVCSLPKTTRTKKEITTSDNNTN